MSLRKGLLQYDLTGVPSLWSYMLYACTQLQLCQVNNAARKTCVSLSVKVTPYHEADHTSIPGGTPCSNMVILER
jgi:hypothetical protein